MIAFAAGGETQRQAVLDEWAARCRWQHGAQPGRLSVRHHPEKAIRGEFKIWAGDGLGATTTAPSSTCIAIAETPPSNGLTAGWLVHTWRNSERPYAIRDRRYPQG